MKRRISCLGCDLEHLYSLLEGSDTFSLTRCPDGFMLSFDDDRLADAAGELAFAAVSALPKCAAAGRVDPSLDDEERVSILAGALYEIYGDLEALELERALISNCYHQLLGECETLDLLGALRFRLPCILRRWEDAVLGKKPTSDMAAAHEILDFLAQYAENAMSELPFARIVPLNDRYLLVDADGSLIDAMPPTMSEFEGMAAEDILLSRLINLSPQVIDASAVDNELLLLLLERIFSGRLLL